MWEEATIIFGECESLLKRLDRCKNNLKKLSTKNVLEHVSSGFSIFAISSCKIDKDAMKKFCGFLKEDAMEIINFEKKKMIPLTNKEHILYHIQQICHICKKHSKINTLKIWNIARLEKIYWKCKISDMFIIKSCW